MISWSINFLSTVVGALARHAVRRAAIGAAAFLSLAGCATAPSYAPASSFTTATDIEALKAQFASATSIHTYYGNGAESEQRRNEFIAGRLVLYDLAYADFISHFRFNRAAESTVLDTATLGVNAATTLFGGARTKQVLGAIAGLITGTRSSYEKNFYNEEAAGAIIAQMNAERKSALIPILQGTKSRISDYPLTAALVDLNAYQFAGTVDGALMGIQRDAGLKQARAEAQIDQYRTVAFAPDDSSERIKKWLWPGVARFTAQGVAMDANGAPVSADQTRLTALKDELAKLGLDGLSLIALFNAGDLAKARATAISDLKIP
jgi:hypothetical protein